MPDAVHDALPYIVIGNAALVALALIGLAVAIRRGGLAEVPGPWQNGIERALEWFVDLARTVRRGSERTIAPFLAALFAFILGCNLLVVLPLPIVQIPPTAYYGTTLALALVATFGTLVLSARLASGTHAITHLFWPNPLQLVSVASHALSLSLRLFGNIGGELFVTLLIVAAVPYGMPLVIHVFWLVPVIVQPMVFTLLVTNFLAESVEGAPDRPSAAARETPTLAVEVP